MDQSKSTAKRTSSETDAHGVRKIVQDGDPVLRLNASFIPTSEIQSPKIQTLIADMSRLLSKEEYGVALAAPQVGEPIRLFIVSGRALIRGKRSAPDRPGSEQEKISQKTSTPPPPDLVYINPELVKISHQKSPKHEGCLSLRGMWGEVSRAEKISIRAFDEKGASCTRGASGFLAHIFQHELDHLEGILYTDKALALYEDDHEKHETR